MGLKSMHAEKQSEQPQQSVQDNSLIEQQSQRIAELMKEQEQDSYLIEQQSQKIAELERHISQITQQSQRKTLKSPKLSAKPRNGKPGQTGTDQGKRPGTETTGRTTEPQKDLAEERLASLRSHKPSRGMEEPSREIGDTDTETLIREARAGIDSSRTREENSGADRANREAERADNVLKLNAELKKQNEKLKQDKLNAEQEAEATVSSVKREYEAKGRELDRRIGEAAKQSASLKSERQSISEDIEQRATAKYLDQKKELDRKFKARQRAMTAFC